MLNTKSQTPDHYVTITIDDGYKSVIEQIFPITDSFDIPATLFVPCNFIGKPEFLDWNEINYLKQNNWEIGGHGFYHIDLTSVPKNELENEVKRCYHTLGDKNLVPRSFCYPQNRYNQFTDQIVLKYFQQSRKKPFFSFHKNTTFQDFKDYVELKQSNNENIVLVFHDVLPQEKVCFSKKICCSKQLFTEVIQYLQDKQYQFVTFDQFSELNELEPEIQSSGCFDF